jgi:hypothetical protein
MIMEHNLDKILQRQTINIISLMLVTLFLYFKNGIYKSKYLLNEIENIKKKLKNNREIMKHFKVEYRSIKSLEFFHYFRSMHNKEIIIDYSSHQLPENTTKICISVYEGLEEIMGVPFNYESFDKKEFSVCIDKKAVEKWGLILAFELDNILIYQNLDFDLLPYKMGKKFAEEIILNIIKKKHYVNPFEIINFVFASFVNGLLDGFFEKYRKLDKKEIEEISKNVYIFKSGEEYLNTLKRMLEFIYNKKLQNIIRNTMGLIEENRELFKEIENYGRILGYTLGEYLDNNPKKIYEIYNKYTEIIAAL